ncbi:transporter substrate-binding domain-containing protein [Microbacterium sp. ARD32]|uniref:transporter substrate-binding domain-containing protein n=1 Tax=Microbacterium sp. ARD32 TaxID=2962577 RepID=UPI002880D1C5|nr:transporter substrate-binding domain-containing protein [Microbacterium sp. ARD32]MDT0156629.1 transporter substrate-binding domain-containing protein [Microbacterium sp. ARD32]
MTRKAALTALATMGVLTLALAGCTSGGDGGSEGAGSQTTLEKAQESGTIKLAINGEQPYSWKGDDGPTGATIAIHKQIFKNLGIDNIEVEQVDWDNLIPGLNAGRWDVVSAGMSILPERCEQAAFSDPEIMYTTTLAVPKGNPKGLSDLDSVLATGGDVKLALQSGAIEAGYVKDLGGYDNTVEVDSAANGLETVASGRADAFALTAVSLNWMTEKMDDLETTEAFVQEIDGVKQIGAGATVFRKADKDLLEAYNKELAKITGDEQAYLDLVEPFGFTAENLPPENVTTEKLCAGDLDDLQ